MSLKTGGMGQAWQQLLQDLLTSGNEINSRLGKTKEILGYTLRLDEPKFSLLCNSRRAISPAYASAELLWYLSADKSANMLLPYAPQYKNFTEDDGTAYGAYGPRVFGISQWANIKKLLTDQQSTRQAVVAIWNHTDLYVCAHEPKRDVPCTLTWQFLVRDNELHMVVNMRSNDAWLGTPYDVWCFTAIQKLLAGDLGLYVGSYVHTVGSMHLYEKHFDAASEAAALAPLEITDGYTPQNMGYLRQALNDEHVHRLGGEMALPTRRGGKSALLTDATIACASAFRSVPDGYMTSPALNYALYAWRTRNVDRGRHRPSGQNDPVPEVGKET